MGRVLSDCAESESSSRSLCAASAPVRHVDTPVLARSFLTLRCQFGGVRSCVRPHMGAVSSSYFISVSFVFGTRCAGRCDPRWSSHQRRFPANLTSGGIAFPPRSRIRDGGAPRRRHHSLRRCISTRPDNDDAPLNPYPGAVRLGINFGRRSRCGLHHRTFRHHALCGEPPQGDQ
jgi:hypothetical protein